MPRRSPPPRHDPSVFGSVLGPRGTAPAKPRKANIDLPWSSVKPQGCRRDPSRVRSPAAFAAVTSGARAMFVSRPADRERHDDGAAGDPRSPARRARRGRPAARDSRARMREELKALSLDVMAQTGDSLAQQRRRRRAAPSRSAPPARWRERTEEIKGVVAPVQEKLGAHGERDRAPRARAPPGAGRARADGPPARRGRRHAAPGDRQPRLRAQAPVHARLLGRDPAAQRRRDGGHGLPLRLRRAEHDPDRRRRAAPRHARAAARRQGRRRRLEGAARRLPVGARGRRGRASASRTPRATRARRASTSPSSPPRATSASSTRRPSSS